jgi:predicted membrane channel-forming protein YqfA (hemolysin III family)
MSRHDSFSADPVLRLAQRRARAKMGFFIHLAVFVLVNALLVTIDLLALRRHGMSIFPAMGWGLGLAIHGAVLMRTHCSGPSASSVPHGTSKKAVRCRSSPLR